MTVSTPIPTTGGYGVQGSGNVKPFPPPPGNDAAYRSHAEAERSTSDVQYLVYVMVQAAKLFISLIARRWPDVR